MIKLIAFDLDGTIADTIPLCIVSFQKAISPYTNNNLTEEEIIQTFGLNEEGMIKQLVKENWEKALNDFYIRYTEMHIMCPSPFDGIKELIRELKVQNFKVILITGKGKKSCDITLEYFEMENYFDFIATGSPQKNIKAETLHIVQEKYDLQADEMIYIGDTVSDIQSCKETGVQCLSAGWATSTDNEELKKYNENYVFGTVESLRKYLLSLHTKRYA